MGKKKISSLSLNKKVVSNFSTKKITGGHYSAWSCAAACETLTYCPNQSLDKCWVE